MVKNKSIKFILMVSLLMASLTACSTTDSKHTVDTNVSSEALESNETGTETNETDSSVVDEIEEEEEEVANLDYGTLSEKGQQVFTKLFVEPFYEDVEFQEISLRFAVNMIGKEFDNSLFKEYSLPNNSIILFGKTTCPSCSEAVDELTTYAKETGTNVVVIYYRNTTSDMESYINSEHPDSKDYLTFLSADDLLVSGDDFVKLHNLEIVPSMLFVDDNGKIGFTVIALPTQEYLEEITLSAFEGFIVTNSEDEDVEEAETVRLYDLFE